MSFNPPGNRLGYDCNPCGPPDAPQNLTVEELDEALRITWSKDVCTQATYQYRVCGPG